MKKEKRNGESEEAWRSGHQWRKPISERSGGENKLSNQRNSNGVIVMSEMKAKENNYSMAYQP